MNPLFRSRRGRVLLTVCAVLLVASGCVKQITPIPSPKPAAAFGYTDMQWFLAPMVTGQTSATVGILPAKGNPTGWTVLVLPGGGGADAKDLGVLRELSARGINAVYACYFAVQITEWSHQIQCPTAPERHDLWSPAIGDIDAVVEAAKALFPNTRVAVSGASLSGYWALARAAAGRAEPVIDIAGFSGPVLSQVGQIAAPVLILHGDSDGFILPSDSTSLRDAMVTAGKEVELLMVPGGTHGMMMESWSQAFIADAMRRWLAWH